jgi:hypothetical protein
MSEDKIVPERWREAYEGLLGSKNFATLHCLKQIQLIEEIGAAEAERDTEREQRIAAEQFIQEWIKHARDVEAERDALKAEVERLKYKFSKNLKALAEARFNELKDIAQGESVRIAQARRDALEEAAKICDRHSMNLIADEIRALADKL